jgi:phosphoglycolate phosphatase-like HAD superfamily hydrolase
VTSGSVTGLDEIAARCEHLLLDFDGPVCAVFATIPSHTVASELRDALRAAEIPVPESVADADDPLEVFQEVARSHPKAAPVTHRELTRLELRAITGARPTEGAADLIATAGHTGRTVTIVSNNSGRAIRAYLRAHGLTGCLKGVIGRDDADPEHMKPSPYRVREAVGRLGAEGSQCVFVGDSLTDVLSGLLAGVPVIGFANKPGKAQALTQAGARAVTTRLSEISTALRAAPQPALPN